MTYYFSKKIDASFEEAIIKVTDALKSKGFGILTEIDVKETLHNKLDVEFRPYKILGACNPPFAYKAISAEDKIGVMLPCNVIIQQFASGVEVSAVNPVASMMAVNNVELEDIALQIQSMLKSVIDSL